MLQVQFVAEEAFDVGGPRRVISFADTKCLGHLFVGFPDHVILVHKCQAVTDMYNWQDGVNLHHTTFALILSYVNLVAPPFSANKHRNRSEQLREIRHTLNVVGPWISLDGWQ